MGTKEAEWLKKIARPVAKQSSSARPPEKWTLAEIVKRGKLKHQEWLEKIGHKKEAQAAQGVETEATDALSDALARSPLGRRVLDMVEIASRERVRASLAQELERDAEQELDRVRAQLQSADAQVRYGAPPKIALAERKLERWRATRIAHEQAARAALLGAADMARALTP